jgi:hypothetical protein
MARPGTIISTAYPRIPPGIPFTVSDIEWTPNLFSAFQNDPEIFDGNPSADAEFEQKLAAIKRGESVELYAGEFLRYVILRGESDTQKQEERIKTLEAKIEANEGYLQNTVFCKRLWLNNYLQQKMALLTNTDVSLWRKRVYSPEDAKDIHINMSTDIRALNQYHRELNAWNESHPVTRGSELRRH